MYENTHFNKYGAWLLTKGLIDLIRSSRNPELYRLNNSLKDTEYEVTPPI